MMMNLKTWGFGRLVSAMLAAVFALTVSSTAAAAAPSKAAAPRSTSSDPVAATGKIQHVFIIMLENENLVSSYGPNSGAPYLSKTLRSMGAFVPNYYGIGHNSLDNYVALISGQSPNPHTQNDCQYFTNFISSAPAAADGVAVGRGCIYPTSVSTLADQMDHAGLTWKAYMEDMGNDPSRESATCGHPPVDSKDNTQDATPTDQYATRHDPFVYFHRIIDRQNYCDEHVVNFDPLVSDLSQVATTSNLVFITPNLCNDGHDSPCANGDVGGLAQINQFLQQWVPQIIQSPAYLQDGLLLILFDESEAGASACCGEPSGPNTALPGEYGPGGGRVGAVFLSPYIAPGTVANTNYNHYSTLRSLEDIFGVGHLGFAGASGSKPFGADVFTKMP